MVVTKGKRWTRVETRERRRTVKAAKRYLADSGEGWANSCGSNKKVIKAVLKKLGADDYVDKPLDDQIAAVRARLAYAPSPNNTVKNFYQSYEWRKVRFEVLAASDRRCVCCGRGPKDGVTLNVDHIKPLRYNWELRIDKSNLQVLCAACNHGKGNRKNDLRDTG